MKQRTKKGKRDWVKNAIIIFLAVLLVLTFFSNTIMNYSLPEVAAQYPQSTAITTKIRGTGVVEAAQSYNVQVDETRKVAKVNVAVGDTVTAGQLLLTLDETESQELADARAEYEALKLEYDKSVITVGEQSHAAAHNMQQLRDAVSQAQKDLSEAEEYEEDLKTYQDQVTRAQENLETRQAEAAEIQRDLDLLNNEKANITVNNAEYLAANEKVKEAQAKVDEIMGREPARYPSGTDPEAEELPEETPEYIAWQEELATAQKELDDATRDRDELLEDLTLDVDQRIAVKEAALINANAGVTSTSNALSAAQSELSRFQSEYTGTYTSSKAAQTALKAAQDALAAAEAAAADESIQHDYDDALAALDQNALVDKLKDAEDRVKELEEHAAGVEVTSRYAGVVTEVNIAAGDTTQAETTLVVVELTQQGYTLSATVTKSQAKTLRQGLTAEITNLWNPDINLVLQSITNDKNDPANSRILNFSVQGDVAVGQELSFSIGDKNAKYDVVLPTAAIHSDADGSFVYTVAVKSSPLGNRYTVKRSNVTVVASDEVNSAVTGDISTTDFVITTSTLPLKVGDQIRIAE